MNMRLTIHELISERRRLRREAIAEREIEKAVIETKPESEPQENESPQKDDAGSSSPAG
jgi:hypothetical protein